jgi:hypothetical protein
MWTQATGLVGLGLLPGLSSSVAYAVSGNGEVVVGSSTGSVYQTAMMWDANHGMRSIQQVLMDDGGLDLTGWYLVDATAVSYDGSIIVGRGRNPAGQAEAWMAVWTAVNDNDLPTVSIAATDPNAAEAGQDKGTFTITRVGDLTAALTVYYTVVGSASADDYHETLSGSVTIAAGQASEVINITPVDDTTDESDETVVLTLSNRAGYVVGSPYQATVTIADNEYAVVTTVKLNGSGSRSVSAADPSGRGIRTIEVCFSEAVTFSAGDVLVQTVGAPGADTPVTVAAGTAGSRSNAMLITLATPAVDTWVKVTISGSGTLADLQGHLLDGDAPATGSGRGYLYDAAADLPTGDGLPGGDAVFYVGSLRCDFNGDLAVGGPDDLEGFKTAWRAKRLDADFRGVGFSSTQPDGRLTLADVDAFTRIYQAAVASGRHLDPLPTGIGSGAGSTLEPLTAVPQPTSDLIAALRREGGVTSSATTLAAGTPSTEAALVETASPLDVWQPHEPETALEKLGKRTPVPLASDIALRIQ